MGCTGSKQARRDRHRSPTPYDRSHSLPVRRRPAAAAPKPDHVVSLTSSTLGYLKLDPGSGGGGSSCSSDEEEMMKCTNDRSGSDRREELAGKARAWSEMMELRIPRTPTKTPTHEPPETINTWELMAGLEDASPLLYSSPAVVPTVAGRSVSFSTVRDADRPPKPPKLMVGSSPPAPASIVSEFDPQVISNFRKALEELSPQHPFLLRSPHRSSDAGIVTNGGEALKPTSIVKARITAFQERIDARRARSNAAAAADGGTEKVAPFPKCPPGDEGKVDGGTEKVAPFHKYPPGDEGKVVFYFTSLRGVRKTYEDCWNVKVILQGYGLKVDERDVSMHGGFKEELKELLGGGYRLPRVFAAGAYLGGAEEVRQMHETGELGKALEGCEMAAMGKGGVGGQCEGCGDVRFVPCETCSGSCKVYVEEEEEEEAVGGFRRCPECNENGLVRCPLCC